MKAVLLKNVKKGDYFKFKPTETSPVMVRGVYSRADKKYEFYRFYDVNHYGFRKGNVIVYVD